jgi:uncharacterized protein YqeY
MTLQEQISADFMTAFKAKDMDKKTFLGLLKGEIQTESSKPTFNGDESVLKIVKKMEKSLKEVGDADSLRELTYIEGYLPSLMSEEAIRDEVTKLVEGGADNIGAIMGGFNKQFAGKADNKLVSQIARELV